MSLLGSSQGGWFWARRTAWQGRYRGSKKTKGISLSIQCFIGSRYIYECCPLFGFLSNIILSSLIWSCILLPFVSTLLSFYFWHLLAIDLSCGDFVANLPLHSYYLGFGTALSWLLVSCRFLVVWCFEWIFCCRLKLSYCKRVLLWIFVAREVCARRDLLVCLWCAFKKAHSKRFTDVGGEM